MKRIAVRKILIGTGALLLAGWATGIVAANTAKAVPCVKPTGFSALVSAAFFSPGGNCKVKTDGSCQDSGECNTTPISGSGVQGKCTNVTVNKVVTCECVAK